MSSSAPKVPKDTGPFEERNANFGRATLLNKLGATFDVEYRPQTATLIVTFRARYKFHPSISLTDQMTYRRSINSAIGWWDDCGFCLRTQNPEASNREIRFSFQLIESPTDYHRTIDVGPAAASLKEAARPQVVFDVKISIDWKHSIKTMAHELGHVFGNPDEYKETHFLWQLCSFLWHDDQYNDDITALMNVGTEFRDRYFEHFAEYMNDKFEKMGIVYHVVEKSRTPRLQPPQWTPAFQPFENLVRRLDYGTVTAGSYPRWQGATRRPVSFGR